MNGYMKSWMTAVALMLFWLVSGSAATAQEESLPSQGSMICENYQRIYYTFEDGTLNISGEGDCLRDDDRYLFNDREEIRRVVFDSQCGLKDISQMFVACVNLTDVTLSPEITDMASAFDSTGLKKVPQLPEGVENISRAFINCTGITEIDFQELPASITNFTRAFQGTSVRNVSLMVRDKSKTGLLDYSYCFAYCPALESVWFDGSDLNDGAFLWLEGLCDGCAGLKSFMLENVPESNRQRGIYNAVNMFRGCGSLTTVINCGGFFSSAAGAFQDCTSLVRLETTGFENMYAGNCLQDTFRNCSSLRGSYRVSFLRTSSIYRVAKSSSALKENVKNAFKNCSSGLTMYIGCKDLVTYLKKRTTKAKFSYWKAGDPTGGYTSVKKTISTLKLTKYKKKTKRIEGKTVKKGKVTVKFSGRTYKTTANGSGKFAVRVRRKLKRGNKIKVTVSKSGYKNKSKAFKVK